ncbi:SH3 domain-containing protein [Thermodesulfobacteriota bacterium]
MKKNVFVMLMIGILAVYTGVGNAIDLKQFTGKIVEYSEAIKSYLVVEGRNGKTISFRTGFRTRFYPLTRWTGPKPGEWVKVEYLFQKGEYIAYRVTKLEVPPRHSSPPSKFPPPVHEPDEIMSGSLTVIGQSANLRSGPGKEYRVVGSVAKGQYLDLKGMTGSWYKVHLSKRHLTAWVYAPLVKVNEMKKH